MVHFTNCLQVRPCPTGRMFGNQSPDALPINKLSLSRWSTSGRHSCLHELTPCWFIQSAPTCPLPGQTERAQIILNCSQSGLPRSTTSASPVFGRTMHAGLKSLRMVFTSVGMTKVAKEIQAPLTDISDRSGWPMWDRMSSEYREYITKLTASKYWRKLNILTLLN